MDFISPEVKDLSLLRRALFASLYLPEACPGYWTIVAKFAKGNSSQEIDSTSIKVTIENLKLFSGTAFVSDDQLVQEIHSLPGAGENCLGVVLISCNEECKLCKGKLLVRSDRPSHLTVYTESLGTIAGTHFHKYCQNNHKGCPYRQYYGYYSQGNSSISYFDTNWDELKYFVSSSETAIEMSMLRKFDSELLLGQISYNQKADIYNYSNGYEVQPKQCSSKDKSSSEDIDSAKRLHQLHSRFKMDRRRFETAHLKYAILTMADSYPEISVPVAMHSNINETLKMFTPFYYESFETRYAEHSCNYPGCQEVLVIDGNMKNRRDVCMAKNVGFVEYPGLPGHVKSGCTSSPLYKSRYCGEHKTHACNPQQDDSSIGDQVVEMIVEKRQQEEIPFTKLVVWLGKPDIQVTWESAASLPVSVVEEYEKDIQAVAVTHTEVQYGQPQKGLRIDRPVANKSTGAFANDADSEMKISCNTEKDRHHHMNLRTAGILAGMRPCGIIVFVGELFMAESKTQVYGFLHNFFSRHPNATKRLDIVCYDDACHLKKFSINPKRSELTEESRRLAAMNMAVDKMHMRGHTDKWCKYNCDPKKFPLLDKVDTEVCEQVFSWLSRYKRITQKMNEHTFMFFILYLSELHNILENKRLYKGRFM